MTTTHYLSLDAFINNGLPRKFPRNGTYNYWEWDCDTQEFLSWKIDISKKTKDYLYFTAHSRNFNNEGSWWEGEQRCWISRLPYGGELIEGFKHLNANQLFKQGDGWEIIVNGNLCYKNGAKLAEMEVAGTMSEEIRECAIKHLEEPAEFLTSNSTMMECMVEIAKQEHIELQELKRKYAFLKKSIGDVLKYH